MVVELSLCLICRSRVSAAWRDGSVTVIDFFVIMCACGHGWLFKAITGYFGSVAVTKAAARHGRVFELWAFVLNKE